MEIAKKSKTKKLDIEFIILELIQHWGWSYSEIQNAPEYMVELAIWKMNLDNKNNK